MEMKSSLSAVKCAGDQDGFDTASAVLALTALAQPSRLEVFRLLAKQGKEGMQAGVISGQLNIPKPTLSFHLKELTQAGLLESKRDGRSIIYSLKVSGMRHLIGFLTEDCCRGLVETCQPSNPLNCG